MTVLEHLYILPHMKPDKRTCKYCGKELFGRASKQFCKKACSVAYYRNNEQPESGTNVPVTQNVPVKVDDVPVTSEKAEHDLRSTLTKTDKTFYDRAMKDFGEPYYNFDWAERSVKCGYCGTPFKTKLRLNRYCSYKHFKEAITVKL